MSWDIEWHDALPSTMDRARELAEHGATSGTVVVAGYQSQGRGTHERQWEAAPGTCLMFTLVARPVIAPSSLPEIPLAVARSVARFLCDRFGVAATVSPPNDIHVNGNKLCGILCTSRVMGDRLEWVLCGIGLNTFMTEEQIPVSDATSLATEGVEDIPDHAILLPQILAYLEWMLPRESVSCARYADKPILYGDVQ